MRTRDWAAGPGWGGAAIGLFLMPAFLTQGCDTGVTLDTRTFELQYLSPDEAVPMIMPYVYTERADAPGTVNYFSSGITVRETPEALERIEAVLEKYDRAKPGVRLHFQVIEADGFQERDPQIEEVRAALEDLFRFDGYRLAGETQMALMEATTSNQMFSVADKRFRLHASVEEVRGSAEKGSVTVSVVWEPIDGSGPYIRTTLAVPVGETVVLGSSRPSESEPTTILTVRPEFVTLRQGDGS